ncbi:MAG: galactokinase [Ginsengibacter sp.]|jgi:galactokinase
MNETILKINQLFKEKFKGEPSGFWSPGRINLIGEHIDYNDGFVMPGAIDKGIYYAIAFNDTDHFNFYAVDYDETFSIKQTEIKQSVGWKNYVLGVIYEFTQLGNEIKGFDCVIGGNIANGAGISSSAAVEGGMAFSINELMGFGLDRKELALLCQRAEHNFPGVNCGIMDQYANMHGKKDHVMLLDCQSITHEYLPFKLTDSTLVLINTNVHHNLAASAYNERRQQCEKGLKIMQNKLGINSFREVESAETLLQFKEEMGEIVYQRCLYVVEEILRTKQAAVLLKKNDIEGFGKLMFQTHYGLQHLYSVSCPELDFLVDFASKREEVIGARLMGGGFGGCTINIIKNSGKDNFLKEIASDYKSAFNIEAEMYEVKIMDGTHQVS